MARGIAWARNGVEPAPVTAIVELRQIRDITWIRWSKSPSPSDPAIT